MTDESLDQRRYEKLDDQIAKLTNKILATPEGPQRSAMIYKLEQLAADQHRALGRMLGDNL